MEFLQVDAISALFVSQDEGGLHASHTPPPAIWKENAHANTLYFLKVGPHAATADDMSKAVVYGEAPCPLSHSAPLLA